MIGGLQRARRTTLGERLCGDRHGAGTTLVLHLVPGVLFAVVAFPLARMAGDRGLPPALGFQAATLLVLAPLQLGTIALAARLRTGSWRLRGALRYTARLPRRRFLLLASATLAWAGFVFVVTGPSAEAARDSLFAWWPVGVDHTDHLRQPDAYPQQTLVLVWATGLLATTLVAPVVEELYFRGFLLPRLEHLGAWAPVVNTALFAAYHVWSPWQAPTRVAATLPLFHATWRTRSIGLAVAVHVALNLIGDTLAAVPVTFR